MDLVLDVLTAVLLLAGGLLSLVAAIGLMRFDDLLSRMHAGTKPQVLGLICVMLAVAIRNPGFAAAGTIILVIGFQLLTVPVSAHMVGRAAYRAEAVSTGYLVADELAEAVSRADEQARTTTGPESGHTSEEAARTSRAPQPEDEDGPAATA
ncbi:MULTISPECIES: monovalent cation/H(+) antiporter subunit G [Rathayibacter]|jgi:multicomponent Na+:H+ antiporter subunit G|uniref:Na+/H+ antiporter subunit G n=1 Tax=Rathayibacter caricis DSM 15933 TaxID=1328867 RepID=A0A2T4UPW5_9MICO|nr:MULTISPECIES: monovalent cation/H(+) antiporter subunit G [Rathayibacter]MCJ1696607.1 monovalent cation/H(+) antiporter subunit G [Rathayibacter caricis]PTL71560.1 Na+/H+ antiporter subunit G [Rathayibacter caricis DSM 15933]